MQAPIKALVSTYLDGLNITNLTIQVLKSQFIF